MTLQSIKVEIAKIKLVSKEGDVYFKPFKFELSSTYPCFCVVGESGSGKTTFFKSLVPRFVADWREYSLADVEIRLERNGIDFFDTNGRIGYAAQRPFFINHHSVRQNLTSPFQWANRHTPATDRVNEVINDFMLNKLIDRKAYQLSAGERQRLNLARMFLAEPEFAMIDECLSPMDEEMATKVAKTIMDKYAPITRLLVTGHRKQDLAHFSNRALLFCYKDESGERPIRNITVTTGNLT